MVSSGTYSIHNLLACGFYGIQNSIPKLREEFWMVSQLSKDGKGRHTGKTEVLNLLLSISLSHTYISDKKLNYRKRPYSGF